MARYVAEGNVLDHTVSGSPVSSGELIQVAGLAGIAVSDGAIDEKIGVAVRGVVAIPKAGATVFSAGDVVEFDTTSGVAVTSSGDYQVGIAAYDAGNGATEVYALLNAQDNDTT